MIHFNCVTHEKRWTESQFEVAATISLGDRRELMQVIASS